MSECSHAACADRALYVVYTRKTLPYGMRWSAMRDDNEWWCFRHAHEKADALNHEERTRNGALPLKAFLELIEETHP